MNLQRRTWEIPEIVSLQLKSLPLPGRTTCTFPAGNTSLLVFPPCPFWPYWCHNHLPTKKQHRSNCRSGAVGAGGGGANTATCDPWLPPDLLVLQAMPDLTRGGQRSSGMSKLRDPRKALCRTFSCAEQPCSAFLPHSSRLFVA